MKIIYYTNQISRPGGLERVLVEKVNAWIGKGYEVEVLTFSQREKESYYDLDDRAIRSGLEIPYNSKKSSYSLTNLFFLLLHLYRLTLHLIKSKPDVILIANCGLEFYFFPFLPTKAKIVKEEHLSFYLSEEQAKKHSIGKKLNNFFYQKFLSYYDRLIVLTKEEMKYFSSKRIVVIPNPINVKKVESVLKKEREKVIISAGRLSSVKQFEKLIEIFNEISADHPDWKLKIFGDGSQRKKLEDKISSYHLQHRVFLPGNTNNIYNEMQKASIFALTSKTEGFSMVLLEAMINGLPVISYDSPNGPRNIIKNKSDGFLVPLNDKLQFKKRLRHLIENRDLRRKMSERGRENVLRFKVSEVMKIWDRLFIDLGLEVKEDERMTNGNFSKN